MATPRPIDPKAGDLLVAAAPLLDPNFRHTVVLLLDRSDSGALGVVLNRPSMMPVEEVLPAWGGFTSFPDVVFAGGPVSPESALAVAPLRVDTEEPVGWQRLYGDVGIVDLDAPVEIVAPAIAGLRVFAGYAGWGEEQLHAEIAEGAWYVVPSLRSDLLAGDPKTLRADVLRRQPGALAWVATRPVDPSMN